MSAPFVWFDLLATEDTQVNAFYRALFGWNVGPGLGDYREWITEGEQPWAGILPGESGLSGRWVPYVAVEDLDAAAKQAIALGGTIMRDKTAGPAGSSIFVADPSGAVLALFTPATR